MSKRFICILFISAAAFLFHTAGVQAVTEFSRSGISSVSSNTIPENDLPINNREPLQRESVENSNDKQQVEDEYAPGKSIKPAIKEDAQSTVEFREVWGYLMRGEEKLFKGNEPVTDICYFSCGVLNSGRINTNVNPPVLPDLNGKKRRVHIVISNLEGYQLMNRALNPENGIRDLLVADILEVSKKFDGVQIDFEAISKKDAAVFHDFLRMIKSGLEPGKIFSIALPSRVSAVDGDAFDYSIISGIVDRVYIMAYDQHWSSCKPGPVASLECCKAIIDFAKDIVPADKLIMGIPLYGREWEERYVKGKKVKVVEYKKIAKGKKTKKSKYKKVVRTVKIPPRIESQAGRCVQKIFQTLLTAAGLKRITHLIKV
jgi:spore germination protein YaaH